MTFDVISLRGTHGFKPCIVVANHTLRFLHLWQARSVRKTSRWSSDVWSVWTKWPVLNCNVSLDGAFIVMRCFIALGCEAIPWELDLSVAPNEVFLKLFPSAKRSSSKSQCHRNAAMETGSQPGPDWQQNRPVSEEVYTPPGSQKRSLPGLRKWCGWCIIVILRGKLSCFSNGCPNRVNKPIWSVAETSLRVSERIWYDACDPFIDFPIRCMRNGRRMMILSGTLVAPFFHAIWGPLWPAVVYQFIWKDESHRPVAL